MLKQRHQLFVWLLSVMDACVVVGACYAAWFIRRYWVEGAMPQAWDTWVREPIAPIAAPIALYSFWIFGLYQPWRDRSVVGEMRQVAKGTAATIVGVIVALWLIGPELIDKARGELAGEAAKTQILALGVVMVIAVGAFRTAFRLGLRAIRSRGHNLRHVAVIGTGRLGRIVCRTLERNTWTGIHVDYFISHRESVGEGAECNGRPVLGGLGDLERIMEEEGEPDAVYLALPNACAACIPELLKRLERYVVDVRIVPDVHPRYMPQSMSVSELEGMPILSVRESPLYGLGGAAKRLLDVGGAVFALVLFSPVMLATALLVRLTSPGPVIFKQRRVSLGGEEFNIYKFRTMFAAEDEQTPTWTQREDPRITPIGRWLRRTSLDELPQLLNVLRGEMSLVGPRPERPELIQRFRDDWRGYMLRQHVKAGITGWAQVNGLRGDTSLRKRLQLDLFYIRHWSIWFDIKILWLTLFRGFLHRNAH
ncbi:MAG: undecaprenyl-phosphate glucose phosphotransferase [Phycisphaerales bacterium]|nr:undecaprenyl-phosphate glucose phosphotransferase [Phycisphaerales bacterium]